MNTLLTATLYGTKHIIGIGIIFMMGYGTILLFKKKSYKQTVTLLTISFFVLEAVKLGYIIVRNNSFPMNHLPFHLCSLPLYLYPFLAIVSNRKYQSIIEAPAIVVVFLAGLMALLMPTNIIGSASGWLPLRDNVLPIVSFIYHGLMITGPLILIQKRKKQLDSMDLRSIYFVTIGFMLVAMIANSIWDKDFMLLRYGNGSPLQFLMEYGLIVYVMSMIGFGLCIITLGYILFKKTTRRFAYEQTEIKTLALQTNYKKRRRRIT